MILRVLIREISVNVSPRVTTTEPVVRLVRTVLLHKYIMSFIILYKYVYVQLTIIFIVSSSYVYAWSGSGR